MKKSTQLLFVLLLSLGGLHAQSSGQIYFHIQAVPPSLWDGDAPEFSFYVPAHLDSIKGVYYYIDGVWGSSLGIASDSVYQDLADKHHFIIMGCKMHPRMSREAHIWSAKASIDALDSLASLLARPAIGALPFFLEGYSLGGQFAWHFTRKYPLRVIAYVTMKGGVHRTDPTYTPVRNVPSLWFKGEIDANFRKDNMDFIFRQERQDNDSRMALLNHVGMGHERIMDTALIFQFFRSCARLRLNPQSSILNTIPSADGYVMHNDLFTIAGARCASFTAKDHSWFPDSLVALEAQRFASQGSTTQHERCGSGLSSLDLKPKSIAIYPNPAQNQLHISAESHFEYQLLSTNGQIILSGFSESALQSIDISALNRGLYLLILRTEQQRVEQRILIN